MPCISRLALPNFPPTTTAITNQGREVTDVLLDKLDSYLSPAGRLYLVALDSNDPHEVCYLSALCYLSPGACFAVIPALMPAL